MQSSYGIIFRTLPVIPADNRVLLISYKSGISQFFSKHKPLLQLINNYKKNFLRQKELLESETGKPKSSIKIFTLK